LLKKERNIKQVRRGTCRKGEVRPVEEIWIKFDVQAIIRYITDSNQMNDIQNKEY
jgi:hypothetical protein